MKRWLFKFERRLIWENRRRWAIVLLIGYLLLFWLDRAIFHWFYVLRGPELAAANAARERSGDMTAPYAARSQLEGHSWAMMLRSAGYLPVWIIAAVVLGQRAVDSARIVGATLLAGAGAEAIKPLFRHVRPMFTDGVHRFGHAPSVPDAEISFGMASSHVAVAVAGACSVLYLLGRPGWVVLGLAAGCAMERMMAGAHFATDCYAGAFIGYAFARLLRPGGWHGLRGGLVLP